MTAYKWDLEQAHLVDPFAPKPLWRDFDNGAVFAAWLVAGILVLGTPLFFLIQWIAWHQAAVSCTSWGHLNGYKTQFVKFNWFDRTCIAQVGHHWLPVDQIRGVGGVVK